MANPNSEEKILLEAKASEAENALSHKNQHLSNAPLEASSGDKASENENPVSHKKKRLSDSPLEASFSNKASENENPVSHKTQRLSDSPLEASLSDKASEDENNPVSHKKQHLTNAPLEASLGDKASEDENLVSHKKQSPSEVASDASSSDEGSWDSEHEEEEGSTFYSDNIVMDKYGEEHFYNTDNEFLNLGPVNWRAIDKWNLPEVYAVFVKGPRETFRCLELLDVIGCRNRFIGCSVELSRTFFAKLNKDEAARMEAVKGIRRVVRRRDCIFDV